MDKESDFYITLCDLYRLNLMDALIDVTETGNLVIDNAAFIQRFSEIIKDSECDGLEREDLNRLIQECLSVVIIRGHGRTA